jgi:hypothetical protein
MGDYMITLQDVPVKHRPHNGRNVTAPWIRICRAWAGRGAARRGV